MDSCSSLGRAGPAVPRPVAGDHGSGPASPSGLAAWRGSDVCLRVGFTFSPPPFLSLGSAAPSPPLSCYPFRASCGHSELFSCPGLSRAWPGKPVISTSGDRALLSHSADKCPREAIELPASGQREGPLMAPPSGTDRTSEGACRPGQHGGQSFAVSAGPATSTQPRPLATVKRGDPRRPDA